MDDLIKIHKDKFGISPIIIGMLWSNKELLRKNILKSIDNGSPYNEEKLLSKEHLAAFKNGNLVF